MSALVISNYPVLAAHPWVRRERYTSGWCERRDSNPHGFTRQNLNLVRLPIPPLSLAAPF